jgi:hypothetical protein
VVGANIVIVYVPDPATRSVAVVDIAYAAGV